MSGTGRTARTARELPENCQRTVQRAYRQEWRIIHSICFPSVQPPGQCQAISDLSCGAATIKTLLYQVDYCFWWYVRSIWRLSDGYLFIFSLKESPLFNPDNRPLYKGLSLTEWTTSFREYPSGYQDRLRQIVSCLVPGRGERMVW